MKARHLIGIAWIGAVGLLLAACAQAPTVDVDAAKHAMDEARQAQAPDYAAQSWQAAQDTETKLETELDAQQQRFAVVRSYTVARQLALDTKTAAEKSRDEAVAGKQKAKTDAETMMAQAREEVGKAHAAVESAPRGKGTEADLASLKSDASSIDETLADMQRSFDAGNYNDTKMKAQAAIDAAKKIEDEVAQAKTARHKA